MSLLPIVGSALGLIQGLNQNRAAERQQRRALDLYARARKNEEAYLESNREAVRLALADGYGDATRAIADFDAAADADMLRARKTEYAMKRMLGYEDGDTPERDGQQAISSRNQIARAAYHTELKNRASANRLGLQGLVSPRGVNAALMGEAQSIQDSPLNQPVDTTPSFLGLFDGLAKGLTRAPAPAATNAVNPMTQRAIDDSEQRLFKLYMNDQMNQWSAPSVRLDPFERYTNVSGAMGGSGGGFSSGGYSLGNYSVKL